MADLNPLIRLNKFKLEEKQRVLSKLYAEIEKHEIQKRAILDSVESEKDVIGEDISNFQMMQAFLNYFQKSKKQIDTINSQISTLEIKINRAIDEMRVAFGELKKIEITQDRRLEALRKENLKKENDLFSEIALEMFRRSE